MTTATHCKAVILDMMGTCTNWHPTIVAALERAPALPQELLREDFFSDLALDWRTGFFREIAIRHQAGQNPEDIDVTHRRVLNFLLTERGITTKHWDDGARSELVQAWHTQQGWPDTLPGLARLRKKFLILALANGSTRFQLDVVRAADMPFHTLLSSELLGKYKPDPSVYRKTLSLLHLRPEEAIMVASHAYDLRAAKKVGMRTIYIHRSTEDRDEDMDKVKREVDFFLEGATYTSSKAGGRHQTQQGEAAQKAQTSTQGQKGGMGLEGVADILGA